jgi:hypothetical protein
MNPRRSHILKPKRPSRAPRQVNQEIVAKCAAVVHPHNQLPPVFKVGDLNEAWDRQGGMGCRDPILVEPLA